MGSHFKGACRPLHSSGWYVREVSIIETIETLASLEYDFVIVDMEHAPLNVETVARMIVASGQRYRALIRLRGHDTATANAPRAIHLASPLTAHQLTSQDPYYNMVFTDQPAGAWRRQSRNSVGPDGPDSTVEWASG
jgi:hypothetical protein